MTAIVDEITNSPLFCSLHGLKKVFEKNLKLKDMVYVFNNNKKSSLARKPNLTYPYGYFTIQRMAISKNGLNLNAIQKGGIRNASNNFEVVSGATNATIHTYFLFPTVIDCELHYADTSVPNIIRLVETLLLLSISKSLNFEILLNSETKWVVSVVMEESSVDVPEIDLESPEAPGVSEIVIPFKVHTQIGFVRDASRVNSDRPKILFKLNQVVTETVL